MSKYVALRDRRLIGGVPSRANLYIINTDAVTSLKPAFHAINVNAGAGSISTLFILCHGYAGTNPQANVCMDAGGMGLQLGKELVLHSNVGMWRAIRNKVRNIVIYACAAGDTEPGNQGTTADGRYLMGALALHTNADVYAADRIQWYGRYKGLLHGRFEWGAWEGQLFRFPSDGATAAPVGAPPVEFSQVMAGTAP